MRNKLKEFIVKHDLTIPYLHRATGISKITLSKLIKTNAPIKPSVLLKLEAKLAEIGFSRLDVDTFRRMVRQDYLTNCEDGINYSICGRNTESYVRFKLCDIIAIEYYPTENGALFCEVKFSNMSKLILHDREIDVFL
jgi:hypothetical protein